MYNTIHSKIEEANTKHLLFEKNDKILVALSGGADSVALLLSLKAFYPNVRLYACHVNHMLRANEADRDMEFVRALCESHAITLEILKTDVGAYAKQNGLSTELAARNIRYGFFEEVCNKHGINKVATAHTLSDNAETVLFNLTRGTGLSGLCGIPAKRELSSGIFIIRPLIYASRDEIEAYLSDKKQDFVTDSTNLTDDYTRNFFRHRIIPLFKEINPSFESSLKNTCKTVKDAQIFIDKTAYNNKSKKICELALLDDCILSSVITRLYSDATGCTLIESVHINAIASLIKNHASRKSDAIEICLPGKVSAIIEDGMLLFKPTMKGKADLTDEYEIKLGFCFNRIEGTSYAVSVSESNDKDCFDGYELISCYKIRKCSVNGSLFARNRRNGDTIRCCGMTKKVKSLLNANKVPAALRLALPFVCDDNGILIIPGIAVRDDITASDKTENNILYIYVYSKTT